MYIFRAFHKKKRFLLRLLFYKCHLQNTQPDKDIHFARILSKVIIVGSKFPTSGLFLRSIA